MSDNNHTPGPWEWKTTPGSYHERCTIYSKAGTAVARHVLPADAPVMAAAPALLATCEKWAAFMQDNYDPGDISWWDETLGAIEKAKGEA
jgi:hypothetical protein